MNTAHEIRQAIADYHAGEVGRLAETGALVAPYQISQRDNGRVLGYDNAHDGHHRHYIGTVEQVDFVSYEDTADRFTAEWQDIVARHSRSK